MAAAEPIPAFVRLHLAPCARLPSELLFSVLNHLDDARDLQRSSLVDKHWHSVATDDRLWEPHYWAFYRPVYGSSSKEDVELQQYYEFKRQAAMRGWLKQAATSPPSSELFEAHSQRVRQALEKLSCSSETFTLSKKNAHEKLDEAAVPVPKPLSGAEEVPMPSFLKQKATIRTLPSFYCLFHARLAADDEVLARLRHHVDLSRNIIPDLLSIARMHGNAARPLFAAIIASQPVTADNVEAFLPSDVDEGQRDARWPRAFDMHLASAGGQPLPQQAHCLTLRLAATKAMGHLERGGAVTSLQALQDQRTLLEASLCKGSKSGVARKQILKCSEAVELAMQEIAVFRAADRREIQEYLDLLALFVWADLHAQDRAAQLSSQGDRPTLPYPQGSTRLLLSRIVSSLRMLGFSVAWGASAQDTGNAFLHTALFCQIQRGTSELTLATIVCAVARRLGVAAAICKAATPTMIVAVEDGKEPAGWDSQRQGSKWSRFLVDVADPKRQFVREVEDFQPSANDQDAGAGQGQRSLLEPASPHAVLERVARSLLRETSRGDPSSPLRYGKPQLYACEDAVIGQAAQQHQLGRLRLFLEGREASPPWPLTAPTLASSLASLPPTAAHAIHQETVPAVQDAEYCAKWIFNIFDPDDLGGQEGANEAVAHMITRITSGAYNLDYELLMRLDLNRKMKSSEEGVWADLCAAKQGQGPLAAPDYYTNYFNPLLVWDSQPAIGLGCAGSADFDMLQRPVGELLPRQVIDPADPANSKVKYGIGTVFRHRVLGSRAVIVGWDTECRSCPCWKEDFGVDDLPQGGQKQPFYQAVTEDLFECYVAQCRIDPIKIPAGTSRQGALTILRDLVPLFNARTYGKGFRTIAVVPWDAKAEGKGKRKPKGGHGEGNDGKESDQNSRKARGKMQPGQIYLVMNAWLKEAWSYELE